MAKRPANASRIDPYKNFRFRVKWEGRYVAGFREASVKPVRQRAAAPKLRGLRKYTSITLKRGYTTDSAFQKWVDAVRHRGPGSNVLVEQRDEAGKTVSTYAIDGSRPVKFQGVANLDATANEVVIEVLTLESEGLASAPAGRRVRSGVRKSPPRGRRA
jgi:phage tail-like protein